MLSGGVSDVVSRWERNWAIPSEAAAGTGRQSVGIVLALVRYHWRGHDMRRLVNGAAIALTLSLALAATLSGCGSGQGPGATATDANVGVITIEQALLAERGSTISVRGALVSPGSGDVAQMLLASVLSESYPPQAGGATLALKGLDLEDLVGLSSTSEQPALAQVTWSDYSMVLGGVIKDGVLEVRKIPRVVSATAVGATVRFSPVSEPISSGDTVWWAFDVKNPGSTLLQLKFSSGQHVEVVLSQAGAEKYRWSEGKAFSQAVEDIIIQPGQTWSAAVNDTLTVPAGEYDLTATITSGVSGASTGDSPGNALPQLTTTIRVN